jgi:hypothetical protein
MVFFLFLPFATLSKKNQYYCVLRKDLYISLHWLYIQGGYILELASWWMDLTLTYPRISTKYLTTKEKGACLLDTCPWTSTFPLNSQGVVRRACTLTSYPFSSGMYLPCSSYLNRTKFQLKLKLSRIKRTVYLRTTFSSLATTLDRQDNQRERLSMPSTQVIREKQIRDAIKHAMHAWKRSRRVVIVLRSLST